MAKRATGKIKYRNNPGTETYSVSDAWKRLQRWSESTFRQRDRTPVKPAKVREIDKLEKKTGFKLPKDVRESLRIFNGQCPGPGIVFGMDVLPVEDILCEWELWRNVYYEYCPDPESREEFDNGCASFPVGWVREQYFDRGWIPMTIDYGGNNIAVDLNPGPEGVCGQVIIFGKDDQFHPVLAESWGQFLTDLADELEAGNVRVKGKTDTVPEINPASPRTKHFHSIGIVWSRAKLGYRRLRVADERIWKEHRR